MAALLGGCSVEDGGTCGALTDCDHDCIDGTCGQMSDEGGTCPLGQAQCKGSLICVKWGDTAVCSHPCSGNGECASLSCYGASPPAVCLPTDVTPEGGSFIYRGWGEGSDPSAGNAGNGSGQRGNGEGQSGSGSGQQSAACSSSAACDALTAQCASTISQAPCYCAAACACKCASDASCEQKNRASAQSLGTTCSY
jgi:hypothetical protein